MNRSRWLFVLLITVLLVFATTSPQLNAQDNTEEPPAEKTFAPTDEPTLVPTEPLVDGKQQTLNVYNWTTYIAEDTVPNFEKLYNVKVTYDTYEGMDALFAKMQGGNPGYDIIVPSDYVVQQLIAADLLEELNMDNLPNYTKNVAESFKNPIFDPGNKYCVAYQWGTMGLGYNIKRVGKELTGWGDIFAPDFKGRIALMNSARDQLAAVLIMLGKDPNTTDRTEIEAARDFLLQNKDKIVTFHDDDGQTKLARGEVDVVFEWSGDIFQAMEEDPDIRYVIPKEGSIVWTDNLCIPKGAQNKQLAEKFINYIYDAKVGADISNYTLYGTPNQAALDQGLIDQESLENPAIYPPQDVLEKLEFLKELGDDQAVYDEVFADLKAAISQ